MSLLDRIRRNIEDLKGTCETCGNLAHLGGALIGCESHDKLILPEYPPYHGNMKCPDWKQIANEPGTDPGNGHHNDSERGNCT